ncbi:MAG TPA: hypothetical protein VIM31_00215 [Candidatus Microsaccharimonas sp.]|jgi:hypothetical protein
MQLSDLLKEQQPKHLLKKMRTRVVWITVLIIFIVCVVLVGGIVLFVINHVAASVISLLGIPIIIGTAAFVTYELSKIRRQRMSAINSLVAAGMITQTEGQNGFAVTTKIFENGYIFFGESTLVYYQPTSKNTTRIPYAAIQLVAYRTSAYVTRAVIYTKSGAIPLSLVGPMGDIEQRLNVLNNSGVGAAAAGVGNYVTTTRIQKQVKAIDRAGAQLFIDSLTETGVATQTY